MVNLFYLLIICFGAVIIDISVIYLYYMIVTRNLSPKPTFKDIGKSKFAKITHIVLVITSIIVIIYRYIRLM